MKDTTRWLVLIILVGSVVAAAFYFFWQPNAQQESQLVHPASEAKIEPRTRHPIQEGQSDEWKKPLPPLNESDEAANDVLRGLLGRELLRKFFRLENIVRRLVITIDNLPLRQVPLGHLPVRPARQRFLTRSEEDALFLSPHNYRRYQPYARLAEAVDAKKLVATYIHFYPLFQQAYEELGYPSKYFNDRLVEAIDDLLATPDLQGPIKLTRPKVMYQFADPELEARSAGQKILIRMGSENAARIKGKLRKIRQELTGGPVP